MLRVSPGWEKLHFDAGCLDFWPVLKETISTEHVALKSRQILDFYLHLTKPRQREAPAQ
jgi:hypothetical protein